MTPYGLINGETQNLGLGGAFVRFLEQPNSNNNGLPIVSPGRWYSLWIRVRDESLPHTSRLISCAAQVIWTNTTNDANQMKSREIGVRFSRLRVSEPQTVIKALSQYI